jgi:hypothetical protein
MGLTQRRLFAINDELAELAEEEASLLAELNHRRHLADDIERDAVLSGGEFDRLEAAGSRADVERFERQLADIGRRRAKLHATRTKLLTKLED